MLPFTVEDLHGFVIDGPFTNSSRNFSSFTITHSAGNFQTILDISDSLLFESDFWGSESERIKTLLFNHIKFENKIYSTKEEITEFVNSKFPRLNPNEKILSILEYLHTETKFDGERVNLSKNSLLQRSIWRKIFLSNFEEFDFYMTSMNGSFIEYIDTDDTYIGLHLTVQGLMKVGEFLESKNSNYCFVAMSFDESLYQIYDQAIESAVIASDFKPIIIRKEDVGSDVTINDAIIASIKKSHFTIADFTFHKAGVYFEAGYALGRGQKVIYLCRADEINKAHFDTRNYQHIVWNSADDLKEKLIAKIAAFIKN